jgi:poly-gamma-glutamate system protein
MKKLSTDIRLLIAFTVLLAGTFLSLSQFRRSQPLEYVESMNQSVELTKKWFSVIEQYKKENEIVSDVLSNVPFRYMIGNEWSEITTTLGSLEAKETSTNPDFSALIIRLLHEADIKSGNKVGVVVSGSFPSLAVSVLAAIQSFGAEAVIMSSVGASTYGANQPAATWIDMESALADHGGLKFRSNLVSIGAGDDSGIGLSAEGLAIIKNAALRNRVDLYIPGSLKESIERRVAIFKEENISLLINIGGNQTALGDCPHSLSIPNGLHKNIMSCTDDTRGLVARMNELGVPFINLLDIKELAVRYGISVSPGKKYSESANLFNSTKSNKVLIAIILGIGFVPLYFLRKNT